MKVRSADQYSGFMATAEENRQVDPESRDGLQVLSRAASALDEIATAPGQLRLVDIGAQLGLAKSTARSRSIVSDIRTPTLGSLDHVDKGAGVASSSARDSPPAGTRRQHRPPHPRVAGSVWFELSA